MIDIEEIEIAVVNKLRLDIPDLEVIPYPDKPESYEIIHPIGAILVSFDNTNFMPPKIEFQAAMIQLQVYTILRNLRSHNGVYEFLNRVRQSVTNDLYINNLKFYTIVQRFIDRTNDLWIYESLFTLPTYLMIGE